MVRRLLLALAFTSGVMAIGGAADARRTAIDQDPQGNATSVTLSGYCDLQGDDCGSGQTLPYGVSFDKGATFTNAVYVQGNGILTFGQSVDFLNTPVAANGQTLNAYINDFNTPELTDYARTLVSSGQYNALDFGGGGGFQQSASLSIKNGTIYATWYVCVSPQSCFVSPSYLTLTPTKLGYLARIDNAGGDDLGYVVDGVYTRTGSTFLLPATFDGFSAPVPEPMAWAMLIAGFGLVGATLRRQRLVRAVQYRP